MSDSTHEPPPKRRNGCEGVTPSPSPDLLTLLTRSNRERPLRGVTSRRAITHAARHGKAIGEEYVNTPAYRPAGEKPPSAEGTNSRRKRETLRTTLGPQANNGTVFAGGAQSGAGGWRPYRVLIRTRA